MKALNAGAVFRRNAALRAKGSSGLLDAGETGPDRAERTWRRADRSLREARAKRAPLPVRAVPDPLRGAAGPVESAPAIERAPDELPVPYSGNTGGSTPSFAHVLAT